VKSLAWVLHNPKRVRAGAPNALSAAVTDRAWLCLSTSCSDHVQA
jgi:hypothetical protein